MGLFSLVWEVGEGGVTCLRFSDLGIIRKLEAVATIKGKVRGVRTPQSGSTSECAEVCYRPVGSALL